MSEDLPRGIRPDHPGLSAPGQTGGRRYLCPFCDWFIDQPPTNDPEVLARSRRVFDTLPLRLTETPQEWISRAAGVACAAEWERLESTIRRHVDTHVNEMANEGRNG